MNIMNTNLESEIKVKLKLSNINFKRITNFDQIDIDELIRILYSEGKLVIPVGKYRFNGIYCRVGKPIIIVSPIVEYYEIRWLLYTYHYINYLIFYNYKNVLAFFKNTHQKIKIILKNIKIILDKCIKL